MRVDSLALRDFRNIEALELTPDPRFNVIVAPNGHGKTNLVEAVYLLAALKSFRSLKNDALIRHGAERARCTALVDRGGVRREIALELLPRSRRVTLNGNSVRRVADFFGEVNVVAFSPEDIGLVRGAPADRRAVVDRMVFNAHPSYAAESAALDDVLKNRNAVLKQCEGSVSRRNADLLDIYDAQLVAHGVAVVARRRNYLARLAAPFHDAFCEIFGATFDAALAYRLKSAEDATDHDELLSDDAALTEHLRDAIRAARPRDVARGFSTVGPHRDDIEPLLQGRPLREFGSQGQHRAFVLAMKISEIRLLEAALGHFPVLVLDDVSSELDPIRNQQLFDFLSRFDGQVFITTTDVGYIRLQHAFRQWHLRDGVLLDPSASA